MNEQMESLLSGIGFYRMSEQRRNQIVTFCAVSAGLHVVALVLSVFIIAMRTHLEEKTVFVAPPPPTRTYEPRKLEHQVKVQKRQRSSSRPTVVPRIVSMKTSNIALPEIKMDPKVINTAFQPKFKAVSGKGVGAGLGTGYGLGGFGPGVSKFDFFGIRGRGDKIAVLVDVSVSMVEEEMGGVTGYMRVKNRVNSVIDALSEEAMFNLVVFGDASAKLFDELVVANDANKKKAKDYLRPFNTEGNWGLAIGNIQAEAGKGLPAIGGSTRLDLALSACFQQGADTILVISDGAPMVMRDVSADEMQAYSVRRAEWEKENAAKLQAFDEAAGAAGPGEKRKVWIPPVKPRPPSNKPPKEGEQPDMGHPGSPGRWEWRTEHHHRGGSRRPSPPFEAPKPRYWTLNEFLTHLRILHKEYYLEKGMKPPVIHCIGYKVDREGHVFLSAIAKEYKGKYRRVQTIK